MEARGGTKMSVSDSNTRGVSGVLATSHSSRHLSTFTLNLLSSNVASELDSANHHGEHVCIDLHRLPINVVSCAAQCPEMQHKILTRAILADSAHTIYGLP